MGFDALNNPDSNLVKLLLLPELRYDKTKGKIDKITLSCLALLWCSDKEENYLLNKDVFLKELTRENSIKYLIEKLIRISTLLVYGRLKEFTQCHT